MPSYIVTCVEGRLTGSQKSLIAEAITRSRRLDRRFLLLRPGHVQRSQAP